MKNDTVQQRAGGGLRLSLVAVLALALLVACGAKDSDDQEPGASAPAPEAARNAEVVLTSAQIAAASVKVETLQAVSRRAQAQAFGRVLSLRDLAGARQSLSSAVSTEASAKAADDAAEAEHGRLSGLFSQGANVSKRRVEEAAAAAADARARLDAAEASLSAERAATSQAWGAELARALETGAEPVPSLFGLRAAALLVTPGAGSPAEPQPTVEVMGPDGVLSARLIGIVPRTDGPLQGAGWLYAAEVRGAALPAGLNVEVLLSWGAGRSGVEIPREAGVWWQGVLWVYVERADGRFARLPLESPERTSRGWFVISGLKPGDRLVTSGAQALFSEEMKDLSPSSGLD